MISNIKSRTLVEVRATLIAVAAKWTEPRTTTAHQPSGWADGDGGASE